jgi:capsular polysaccharide export protein
MNYNFLFFSVNRHQKSYFDTLLNTIKSTDSKVSLHKRRLFWLFPSLVIKKNDIALANEASVIRLKYYYNKSGNKSGVIRGILLRSFYFPMTLLFLLKIKALISDEHFDIIILWNDMKWHQFLIKEIAKISKIKTVFFENGTLPNTVTFDSKGVNFNNSVPRDQNFYLERCIVSELNRPKAVSLSQINKGYIFVPFQVDYDTQIISHSPWVKDMENFYQVLESLVATLPHGITIVIKEHPKSSRNYKYLHYKNPRIIFNNESDTEKLVSDSELVITINSTVGLESIIKNKSVIVLGNAFYSIEGLCQTASCESEVIIKSCSVLGPDKNIKDAFVSYLKEYYVDGDWRFPDAEHLIAIKKRIYETVEKK